MTVLKESSSFIQMSVSDQQDKILQLFSEIKTGESFDIFISGDGKALFYTLIEAHGPVFKWTFIERLPETSLVRVSKLSKDIKAETVGEIAASDIRKAMVFGKHGIDYCCGGKKSVEKACIERDVDVFALRDELAALDKVNDLKSDNPTNWNLAFLCDYIVDTHHKFLKENMPAIHQLLNKVSRVHGIEHPETIDVFNIFDDLMLELTNHMGAEEQVLFPIIKHFEKTGEKPPHIQEILAQMEMDHDGAGEALRAMSGLTDNYKTPNGACNSYVIAYNALKELEADLHMHINLENNLLFVKFRNLAQ